MEGTFIGLPSIFYVLLSNNNKDYDNLQLLLHFIIAFVFCYGENKLPINLISGGLMLANLQIDRVKIMDFMTLRFLEKSENIIFCGSPGVGKTNLAVSIGIEAAKQRNCVYFITFQELISQLKKANDENRLERRIKWFCRYKLLIIDELGYQKMNNESANLFFNLIAKRYEKSSTIITTNSPFSKWGDIFQEPVLTNALLDRLLHHCSVININGPSYRLKDQLQFVTEEG